MTLVDNKDNLNIRATCLNCIDGRAQLPALHWIREQYKIDHVDVITSAGIDGVLASQDNVDEIMRNINISVSTNKSSRIFIVGHFDCKGNPVDDQTHHEHITKSVQWLKTHWPKLEIIGLWMNSHWQVEVLDN